ncbi:glutamate receptor ionotropic, kainate 2 isoform X5 [Bactrocera dorsalis]|uniref:Glutamate receptor ionotropic, kainate 2 isoform X5 n=1 Tax=Bactrocera dorsalis TaxID=27457 RepID=A0ABM3K473_BACDO|nr:glutamate receptor ionotropic, kainate 2 isoform X5 [Bactrocera dorsalis]
MFKLFEESAILEDDQYFEGAISSDIQDGPIDLAFKYAIHSINKDASLLPETKMTFDLQHVTKDDSYHACQKVCALIESGIHAIFGPFNAILGVHIHSICDALDIPHIESRLSHKVTNTEFSINLYPAKEYVNLAFEDIIRYLNWTKAGILYETDFGVLQLRKFGHMYDIETHLRLVNPTTYTKILSELKDKEIHNLIIDTNAANISILLKGILQLQMNEYKYHYLFTSFDIETFDLEDFKNNFANITSFRLVDVGDLSVRNILKNMEAYNYNYNNKTTYYRKLRTIETEPAVAYDSVYIFAIGLTSLQQSLTLSVSNASCASEIPWDGGLSLINYINSVEWRGLTGPIQFKEGRRVKFKLDLVKLRQHSLVKVGEWTPQTRLNITEPALFFDGGTINVTLVVITILYACSLQETPYVMMHYGKNYTGNERFYGFCVDILELIARDVGFDYIIDLVPDRKYGAQDPFTGEWNGMVAQLMKYKADLAVGSMTITYARESVIDFTKPFMNLGISILFKVPSSPASRLFSFMNPLAYDVWLYVLAAYFLVSFTIYVVAKLSPIEWRDKHPCDIKNPIVTNQFTLANSFWFTIGTLMQQGSDINPKSLSTRIVSAIWWFFTLIIIASYTANLAAFLTVERMITPIENAEDLASQTEISYGTLESGSTMTFFRDSIIETYKKMWRNMENKKSIAFTSTYEEGIKRVNQGNFAFLMESTMLDYIVQRDCNLTQIGGLLDTKGYGIATPKGSPWRDKISLSILEFQEKGNIQMLYDRWWKKAGDTCLRKSNSKQTKANALGLDNIEFSIEGGVFVVLFVGIGLAAWVAVFEFWYHYRSRRRASVYYENEHCTVERVMTEMTLNDFDSVYNSKKENVEEIQVKDQKLTCKHITAYCCKEPTAQRSLCGEMLDEFRYALRCMDSHRRPALKRSCPTCHILNDVKEFIDTESRSSMAVHGSLIEGTPKYL